MLPKNILPTYLPRPDGSHIAYHATRGANPGVVFLGGFMSNMNGTKAIALEAWCRRHNRAFVRFDYFGHGDSSGRFCQATIGRWKEDSIAVIDKVTQGPQILVGSSMGGWIMLLAALARPHRIAGLIGIASAADLTEELLWKRFDESTRRQLREQRLIRLPSDYQDGPYEISLEFIEEGRHHLILDNPIPLHCPVRLLHGMRDADVPWKLSTRIASKLASRDVRVTLVKDGDHRLSRDEDLNLLTDTLSDLIEYVAA